MGLGRMVVINYIFDTSQLFCNHVHYITIPYWYAMNQRDKTKLQIIKPFPCHLYGRAYTM